jgi:pyrimidine deaminase RibD-like protein
VPPRLRGNRISTSIPCNKRLSGNRTCVERIIRLNGAIKAVYVGIKEPEVFVGENRGMKRLEEAGIKVHVVEGFLSQSEEIAYALGRKRQGMGGSQQWR